MVFRVRSQWLSWRNAAKGDEREDSGGGVGIAFAGQNKGVMVRCFYESR
jgi:hypothetical protein